MKNILLVLLAIIAVLVVVGGAVAFNVVNEISNGEVSSDSIGEIMDKISNVASSPSHDSGSSSSASSNSSGSSDDNDVVSEEVRFNAQNGEGYYREVTYKDGGFRQYDTESGDLIGSSYDSDQDQLPSME